MIGAWMRDALVDPEMSSTGRTCHSSGTAIVLPHLPGATGLRCKAISGCPLA